MSLTDDDILAILADGWNLSPGWLKGSRFAFVEFCDAIRVIQSAEAAQLAKISRVDIAADDPGAGVDSCENDRG